MPPATANVAEAQKSPFSRDEWMSALDCFNLNRRQSASSNRADV
jgi:hypothetical protein